MSGRKQKGEHDPISMFPEFPSSYRYGKPGWPLRSAVLIPSIPLHRFLLIDRNRWSRKPAETANAAALT